MNDYARVAGVIRYLDRHRIRQPGLAELAAECGLSEAHFHRLFKRWAGATPKDFLQCLTVEHAKQSLRDSANVLDTALGAGLSGPGRLHDLFVALEASSPGEFKRGGDGLTIHWGFAETPFGVASLGTTPRGICHLAFHDAIPQNNPPPQLLEGWSAAAFRRDDRAAARLAGRIFHRDAPRAGSLRVYVRATLFQLHVWRALLRIPEGQVTTYGAVARAIGDGNAARAVGTACGSNPVGWLIPCHRVIRETGIATGYRWGDLRKRAILAREFGRKNLSALVTSGGRV